MDYSEQEVPKYRKKSQHKGAPRSDHKHQYIEVVLHRPSSIDSSKESMAKAKVCTICGRIGHEDYWGWILDSIYSKNSLERDEYCSTHEHWYAKEPYGKFAFREKL